MTRTQWNLLADTLTLLAFLVILNSGWVMEFSMAHGAASRGGTILGLDRHGWGEVHSWASWIFLGLLVVHFILHWEWILYMSKGGTRPSLRRRRIGLVILAVVLLLTAVAATAPFILTARQDTPEQGQGQGQGQGEGYASGQERGILSVEE